MKARLDKRVEEGIVRLAREHGLQKVILFGSRARGTNHERSDIDLAAMGGNVRDFGLDVEEKVWTLLKFDVCDLGQKHAESFLDEIERDGILLYEKT